MQEKYKLTLSLFAVIAVLMSVFSLTSTANVYAQDTDTEIPIIIDDGDRIVHYNYVFDTDPDLNLTTDTETESDSESTTDSTAESDTDTSADSTSDSDTSTDPSASYIEGIYKVLPTDEKGINAYVNSDKQSGVIFTVPKGTYHDIQRFENGYGYIHYAEKSGWIEMSGVQYICKEAQSEYLQTINTAVELINSNEGFDDKNIYEYSAIQELLPQLDFLLADESSAEKLEAAVESLDKDSKNFKSVLEFLSSPESTPLPKGYRYFGDVYYDDNINMRDVVSIQRFLCQLIKLGGKDIYAGDVDASSEISMLDVTWIQKFCADITNAFEAGIIFYC